MGGIASNEQDERGEEESLLYHKFITHKNPITKLNNKLITQKYENGEWTQNSTHSFLNKLKKNE